MHLLFPALIRLFKVDASVDVRRGAIKTLIRLIPCVQVSVRGTKGMLLSFILSIGLLVFLNSFPFSSFPICRLLDTYLRLCIT